MLNCDTVFCKEFSGISGLQWEPWIGDNYTNSTYKMMIVGESHYINNDKYSKKEYTQQCVDEALMGTQKWYTRTYNGINRLLSGYKHPDSSCKEKLWRNLGYYNIIQRVMDDKTKRPTSEDFIKGWGILKKIIEICNPNIIIFIGVTAAKYSGYKIESNFKIGNTNAIVPIFMKDVQGSPKILFAKHTSRYFSWTKWSKEYLEKYIPNEIKFLRDSIK